MIVALTTAKKLNWTGWILGIWGAAISGGAGAVSAGFGTMIIDPKDFNVASGFHHLFELMGVCFAFSAFISLMKFLQTHPVPDPITINTPGPVIVNQPASSSEQK